MYHRFNEDKYPSTNINMEIFKKQIELIEKQKINFISPNDFKLNFNIPKTKKEILLTIDDAFTSFYQNAWPYLKEKKNSIYIICFNRSSWKLWLYELGSNKRN